MNGDGNVVSLHVATEADSTLLSNLLELYIHDMSEVFPHVQLGSDGRFGYSRLPLYWSEPDRRFAFLIRCDDRIGGFILATRGSPAVPDPNVLDVAEFFVLRQYRRAGTGRQAAILLWNRLRGTWIVRVLEKNRGALVFWRDTVAGFTNGRYTESSSSNQPEDWRVFSFDSHLPAPPPNAG
jgi:predicted acetyltransferase